MSAFYDLSGSIPLYQSDAAAFDPSNYQFDETSYVHRRAREDLYQARADFRTPIGIGDDSTIQVGAKIQAGARPMMPNR